MANRDELEKRERELREKVINEINRWTEANKRDDLEEIDKSNKQIQNLVEKHWEIKEKLLKQ